MQLCFAMSLYRNEWRILLRFLQIPLLISYRKTSDLSDRCVKMFAILSIMFFYKYEFFTDTFLATCLYFMIFLFFGF